MTANYGVTSKIKEDLNQQRCDSTDKSWEYNGQMKKILNRIRATKKLLLAIKKGQFKCLRRNKEKRLGYFNAYRKLENNLLEMFL